MAPGASYARYIGNKRGNRSLQAKNGLFLRYFCSFYAGWSIPGLERPGYLHAPLCG
jgi:hypothetical protein